MSVVQLKCIFLMDLDKGGPLKTNSPQNKVSAARPLRTLSTLVPQAIVRGPSDERMSHHAQRIKQPQKSISPEYRSLEMPKLTQSTDPVFVKQEIIIKPDQLRKAQIQAQARIRQLTIRCNQLQQDNVRLSNALKQTQGQAENRERTSITTLEDKLRQMSQMCAVASQTSQTLQEELKKSQQEREHLMNYINTQKQKMVDFERYLESTNRDNQKLKEQMEEMKAQVVHYKDKLAKRQASERQTLAQLEKYSEKLKSKQAEIQLMRSSSAEKMQVVEYKDQQSNQRFYSEIESLNEIILSKNKEIVEWKAKMQMQQPDKTALELKSCRMELGNYQLLLAQRNEQIMKLQDTIRKLTHQSYINTSPSSLRSEMRSEAMEESLESAFMIEVQNGQKEITRLKNHINNLETAVGERDRQKTRLLNDLQAIRQQNYSIAQQSREKVIQAEEKVGEWQRKYQKLQSVTKQNLIIAEREKSSLKVAQMDKTQRLRSIQTQLKDSLTNLANQRRDYMKIRKQYEEKIQNLQIDRANMLRQIDQMSYDLDLRESEVNRIANVGKTVADELQFVSNQAHERKQIIEFLEEELGKANNQYVSARQQAQEARRLQKAQEETIEELEEKLKELRDSSRQHTTRPLRKVVSAASHNFLTMASESPPRLSTMAPLTFPDGDQSPPTINAVMKTLPDYKGHQSLDPVQFETLRRQNRIMKTVASQNQQLQAEVVRLQERLKVQPQKQSFRQKQVQKLKDENLFLKKIAGKKVQYQNVIETQKKKIGDYERQMGDALHQIHRLKAKCLQLEARVKEYQKELLALGRPSILDMGPVSVSEQRIHYLRTSHSQLQNRVYELLQINSELSAQLERDKVKEPSKGAIEFYKQQASLTERKVDSLQTQLKSALTQIKSLQHQLQSCRAEAQRHSTRNSELNSTVQALNLQMGLMNNERILRQASMHQDAYTQRPTHKKHMYRSSDDCMIGQSSRRRQ